MSLKAGVGRVRTTPPSGTALVGYGDRLLNSRGVHDDLFATVLLLDDGEERVALVTLDLLCLNERVVADLREQIAAAGFAPANNTMVCCSHTHAGPPGFAFPRSSQKTRRAVAHLVSASLAAAQQADSELRPAALFAGTGESRVAVNRRQAMPDGHVEIGVNPSGRVDRELRVLQLRGQDGAPLATLVNLACHPAVIGPRNRRVSADWPGALRRSLESRIGGHCLFVQGGTGDLNPNHEWAMEIAADFAAARRIGEEVADSVVAAYQEGLIPLSGAPLRGARECLWLSVVPGISYHELARKFAPWVPSFLVDPILNSRYPWKLLTRDGPDGGSEVALELQALRLGDAALLGQAAESFCEIGLEVKARSPFPNTLFAGYTNGCIGYLPTKEAHAEGGYEVDQAPAAYRMSGRYDPNSSARAVEASLGLLDALAD